LLCACAVSFGVFDADLVKIFFPFQQFALKSNYYQIFAKNTPCQIKAIARFNAMPK